MRIACAIVERNGLILLQERSRGKKRVLEFPCGKPEDYETWAAAARRELWEETGLAARDAEPMVCVLETIEGDQVGYVQLSIADDVEPFMTDPRREQVFLWFPWSGIPLWRLPEADARFVRLMIEETRLSISATSSKVKTRP